MQHFAADQFVAPSAWPSLAGDQVHLWRVVLDGAPSPREVTASAHALLKKMLARYAGLDHAPEIARGEHGKPYAPSVVGIDFNLSHARDHVLLAFARNQPVGVDIERIDRRLALDDLARRFFSVAEADALDRLGEVERLPAFLRLWTCKEAVLKAIGQGLSFGLDRVVLALESDGIPTGLLHVADEAGPREQWRLCLLEPASGFIGALAWHGAARQVRTFIAPSVA